MSDNYEFEQTLTSLDELQAHYGAPSQRSLIKELDCLNAPYTRFIEAAPFAVIATIGADGIDTSPRGDPAGFVRVVDPRTLLLPDRQGNNRIDTLANIVTDSRLSLLFMIPGIGETLRVIGRGRIVVDEALCESFAVNNKPARSVLVITIEKVYFQCQKAIARSRLWADHSASPRTVPTAGEMLQAVDEQFDGDTYDAQYPAHMQRTIY